MNLIPTLFWEVHGLRTVLHAAAVDEDVYISAVSCTDFGDDVFDLLLVTQVASISVACPSQRADLLFDRGAGGWVTLEEDDICTGGCTVSPHVSID